ncbi:MAG: hypothetical protein ACPGVP_08815 [Thiolinea sp.]
MNDMRKRMNLLEWLLNRHVHEYLDVVGRPVGEGRSEACEQIDTQFKRCPYPGSRHQHAQPMNFSALQSITPQWRNIVTLLAWLGQRYRDYNHCGTSRYYDLARISGMGIFLADYLTLRHVNPLQSGQVSVILSGLYKVCLGFQQVTFFAMMNENFDEQELTAQEAAELPAASEFYAWLEENELLIGEAEVCGGSELMISKAYEAMLGQQADSPEQIETVLPELAELEIDWQAYDEFAANASNLWRKAIQFIIYMKGFNIQFDTPALPGDLQPELNTWFTRHFAELLARQNGLTVDIARLTLHESEYTLDEWLLTSNTFLDEIHYQEPEQAAPQMAKLTQAIMQQLERETALTDYREIVNEMTEQQMARYYAYESAVLQTVNHHLTDIQQALGYQHAANDSVSPTDLSTLFGATLRNWSEAV